MDEIRNVRDLGALVAILSISALLDSAHARAERPQFTLAPRTRVLSLQDAGGAPSSLESRGLRRSDPITPEESSYQKLNQIVVTTTAPETGSHIAADPSSPSVLVAVTSDFSNRGGFNTTKYAYTVSGNGEGTWRDSFVPLSEDRMPVTSDGRVWKANSNPTIAIDRKGQVFVASLYFNGAKGPNGIYVGVGGWDGQKRLTFSKDQVYPVTLHPETVNSIQEDKPWIAVDNSSSPYAGTLYLVWSRFEGDSSNRILFSRSTDSGRSWSVPRQISWSSQNGAVQGPQVAVGAQGEVIVAYQVYYKDQIRRHFVARSLDGGQSFSAAAAATPFIAEPDFESTYRKSSFPSLAVSQINGTVFLAYSDAPKGVSGSRIMFVKSTGRQPIQFGKPVMVSQISKGQQFMPAVNTSADGSLHLSWMDTRNAPETTAQFDVYAARSVDEGASFNPVTRVTSQAVSVGNASYIGDYSGIVSSGGFVHPGWTSGGFNNGFLQIATLR